MFLFLHNRSARGLGAVLISSLWLGTAWSEPGKVEFSEIPAKFQQFQDQAGFLWQVNKEAALTSGETQYLPSGMKLVLNGKTFLPKSAVLTDNTAAKGVLDLVLTDSGKELKTTRDLWFDLERGGVRVLDTVKNNGKSPVVVAVELRNAFQFPWQNLVGTSGRILGGGSVKLSERDRGITVKFSVADGRQDTIILARGEAGGEGPELSASSNSRELVLRYKMKIEPGQTKSLLHWILRRNVGKLDDLGGLVRPFYDRRQLINSRIPGELIAKVHNFSKSDFPLQSGPPPHLKNLVSLNELIDRVGVHRRSEDILYFSPDNQLTGEIGPNAAVRIGGATLGISKMAAIEGGGGVGRTPRVFLRDGSVLVGDIELENFSLKIGSEWTVQNWDPVALNLVLFGWDKDDGVPPEKAKRLVELRSGEVIPLSELRDGLEVALPWGTKKMTLDEVRELRYRTTPWPQFRLVESDGSQLGVLLADEQLQLTGVSGKVRSIDSRSLKRIWVSGTIPRETILDLDPAPENLDDFPREEIPSSGFLLQGSNVLAATFKKGEPLALVDRNGVIKIAPEEISTIRRPNGNGQLEIDLKNGDSVKGKLRRKTFAIEAGGQTWTIPATHLIAFQNIDQK